MVNPGIERKHSDYISAFVGIHPYHWQNIPFSAMAFLRRFCQICLLN
jgi:hypothetical protein